MIPKTLSEVAEADLDALITNGVAEGRTIDYKRALPGNSDADKKELLADASSFANSGGGDLVFGMEETGGLPVQIMGVQAADLDLEIRRLDSILAAGVSPRIRYVLRVVVTAAGRRVMIMRVERSWIGPHRVVFQQHDKFYGRNSAGKYPLDVNELRAAFTLSNTATERIRSFRTDRIIALSNNQTPVTFMDSPKIVLHCIPLESFASATQYDVLPIYENAAPFPPMGTTVWDRRLNLNGVLIFGSQQPCPSYTQVYRNGALEVVQGRILAREYEGRMVIPSVAYEQYVLRYLPQCVRLLQEIGANAPVVVALTLLTTRGLYMGINNFWGDQPGFPIDSDSLILPEVVVEDLTTPANRILRPLFDLIWNACGLPRSANFDENGNWIGRG
jgi:hypothetical protein